MKRNSGQTLIATMVVLVIICILAAVYFVGTGGGGSTRADGKAQTVIGGAIYAAKDEVCRSNLGQVRSSLQITWTTDDRYPGNLQETRLPPEFYKCPVGGEPYEYEPQTGLVKCVHPGHGKY